MKPPAGFKIREEGRLWIHESFEPVLRTAGVTSFDDFMEGRGAEILRERAYTSNARWRIGESEFYLKRYRFPRFSVALRGGLKGNLARYSGLLELDNMLRFEAAGVATAQAVAGGDRDGGRWGTGFLLTEAIAGGRPIEEIIPERYSPPLDRARGREKRRLARALGTWVAMLHEKDLHVRDLYLCHVFASPEDPLTGFRLIDLHRAEAGRRVTGRRFIRDLAALATSAPQEFVTRSDRMRLFLAVTGEDHLSIRSKRLVGKILARSERMQKHESGPGAIWSLIHAGVPSMRAVRGSR
ncbi:MAG: hypothetical protein O6952_02070 [Planctomycetota bacterium]|nr:hypothetical protein [Planctomycetota bacterium]